MSDTQSLAPVAPFAAPNAENSQLPNHLPNQNVNQNAFFMAFFDPEQMDAFDLPARFDRARRRDNVRPPRDTEKTAFRIAQRRISGHLADAMLQQLEAWVKQADLQHDSEIAAGETGYESNSLVSIGDDVYDSFNEMHINVLPTSPLAEENIPRAFASLLFGREVFGSLDEFNDGDVTALQAFRMANVALACDVAEFEKVPLAHGASLLMRAAAIVADQMLTQGRAIAAHIEQRKQQEAQAEGEGENG